MGDTVPRAGPRTTCARVVADLDRALQRRLVAVGLTVARRFGFALAGGHAVAAHGILGRPSEDVDLFGDWRRRNEFPAAVDAIVDAYQQAGYVVDTDLRLDTFARLRVTDPGSPQRPQRVELVATWREHDPVEMDIGPVLHPDDVMAGKVDALCNRAAVRDFLDLDAAIASGRYDIHRLCEVAETADRGFDRPFFAGMLARIGRFDDADFAVYGTTPEQVAELRRRVESWCRALGSAADP